MFVSSLEVDSFRNLQHLYLQCSPGLNLIVGKNASGKTSILEALYFLSRARSFRTQNVGDLIHNGNSAFRIVANITDQIIGYHIPLGIQWSPQEIHVRANGTPIRSLAQLAMHLPILLLNSHSHRLLEEGPQHRRRFIDWGLFHTEPTFMMAWKRYHKALRNRNVALRENAPDRTIEAWDQELAVTAVVLESLREAFCRILQEHLAPLIAMMLQDVSLTVDYRRGWDEGQRRDLLTVLRESRAQDRRNGYTRSGPHRADFILRLNNRGATEYLSRGQQKLVVIALILAQANLYRVRKASSCILLIDDLPAELDDLHVGKVMRCLMGIESQFFITAIEADSLDIRNWSSASVFNLKQGQVSE